MDYPAPCLTAKIFNEFEVLVSILNDYALLRYFNFKSTDLKYHCPDCMEDMSHLSYGEDSGRHSFKSVKDEDNTLSCVICGWDGPYSNSECKEETCDSGILANLDGGDVCLCCGEWQGVDED